MATSNINPDTVEKMFQNLYRHITPSSGLGLFCAHPSLVSMFYSTPNPSKSSFQTYYGLRIYLDPDVPPDTVYFIGTDFGLKSDWQAQRSNTLTIDEFLKLVKLHNKEDSIQEALKTLDL
jgi:hypothetical protein